MVDFGKQMDLLEFLKQGLIPRGPSLVSGQPDTKGAFH